MSQLVTVNRAKQTTCFVNVGTTLLTNILKAASGIAETYCDRVFTSAAYTEIFNGDGTTLRWLLQYPATTLTSVTILEPAGISESIATSDFALDEDTGKLQFAEDADGTYTYFPKGRSNITVVYTAGYASDSIPDQVQEAVVQIAKNLYAPTSYNAQAMKAQKIGEWSGTYAVGVEQTALTPLVEALLSPYRRVTA